jgi:hypothetical protein
VADGLRSAATGQHAAHVAQSLVAGGMRCEALAAGPFRQRLVEKLLWASCFWMMSAALGGAQVGSGGGAALAGGPAAAGRLQRGQGGCCIALLRRRRRLRGGQAALQSRRASSGGGWRPAPYAVPRLCAQVGTIATQHRQALQELVQEMLPVAAAFLAASPQQPGGQQQQRCGQRAGHAQPMDAAAMVRGLIDYSLSIGQAVPSRQMAVQEFRWRNGFFLLRGGATPAHCGWLRRAGVAVEEGGQGGCGGVVVVDDVTQARLL